jgi:hypothetical protein
VLNIDIFYPITVLGFDRNPVLHRSSTFFTQDRKDTQSVSDDDSQCLASLLDTGDVCRTALDVLDSGDEPSDDE